MTLIEQRHPAFERLMGLWKSQQTGAALPHASAVEPALPADLAVLTVTLANSTSDPSLRIRTSGAAVDALYGDALVGAAAARLSPGAGEAEREAWTVMRTGRPLMVEDELPGGDQRRRVARLYLPLVNDDGTPDRVLCGIVLVK